MEQDSSSAYRIPQYLYEKQNIFFINFIKKQDEDSYFGFSSFDYKSTKDTSNSKSENIFQIVNRKNYNSQKHFTSNHLLKSNKTQLIKPVNKPYTENWFSISIIICLILFAITRFFYNKRLGQIYSALFINRALSQISREASLKREGISFLLFIAFLISTSLLLYKISYNYIDFTILGTKPSMFFFLNIVLMVFLFYLFKNLLIRFIGYVFRTQEETNDYLLYNLIYILVIGTLLIIPLVIQSYFSNKIGLYIAFVFIILSEIYRLTKEVISLFSYSKFSVLFIFLYLCTVEIIPVMIIYKVLINFIKQ